MKAISAIEDSYAINIDIAATAVTYIKNVSALTSNCDCYYCFH